MARPSLLILLSGPLRHSRRLVAVGALLVTACRSSAPLWPELDATLPQGVTLVEERLSSGSRPSYWVNHRRVGFDVDRVVEIIGSSDRRRVSVRSEYKWSESACRLRAELVAAHLEVVSVFMASSVAPGWREVNGDEFPCHEQTQR
jgi:hypothetical protein